MIPRIWIFVIHGFSLLGCQARIFAFSKAECKSLNPEFSYFKSCELFTKDNKTTFDVYVAVVYKDPIDKIFLTLSCSKIMKNYRIPLFTENVDFCAFMRHSYPTKFSKFASVFFKKHSNINHSCPYQHDLVIKGTMDNFNMFSEIPAPRGNYVIFLRVGTFKNWKAEVQLYARVSP